MRLTKYEHACLVLAEQGKKLVIDPGEFTTSFGDLSSITAVVVTHAHPDHFKPEHLRAIIAQNPNVQIFTTSDVTEQFADPHATIAVPGKTVTVGPFSLEFFGNQHAVILPDVPVIRNVGVLVNDSFYYAGDALTAPHEQVTVLAVPAQAPWLKMRESAEFLRSVAPARCFLTHDGFLNERGFASAGSWISQVCTQIGTDFVPLQPGQSITF